MGNTNARWIAPTPPTNAPIFTTNPTPPTTGTGSTTGTNGAQYGYLYNWCGAMGGVGLNPNACNLTATTGQNVNNSICPAGWRLPTAGADGSTAQNNNTNEFWNLNQSVNGGLTNTDVGLLSQFGGVYAGALATTGSFNAVGSGGRIWSSSIYNATNSFRLYFNSTAVDPANFGSKAFANSVRCVQ
jgi:uncharacterized protein (TIGR02145 family)